MCSKYKDSDRSQLETVADHLLSVFRDAELPFLNIVADQPLDKVLLLVPLISLFILRSFLLLHNIHMFKGNPSIC